MFERQGLIQNSAYLHNTTDFNFKNVLSYALDNSSKKSIEVIFAYVYSQPIAKCNYDFIMGNLKDILRLNSGLNLGPFLYQNDLKSVTLD